MSLSKLQEAMQLLVRTFYEYSTREGDATTMTKTEVSDILWVEFKEPMCVEEMEKIFKNLDTNGDNVVTFKEFVGIVAEIAKKSPGLDILKLSEALEGGSTLLQIMRHLMECFNEYAQLSGHPETMSKGECIFLLSREMEEKGLKEALEITKKLDADKDGVVTFKEFVAIVTEIKPLFC